MSEPTEGDLVHQTRCATRALRCKKEYSKYALTIELLMPFRGHGTPGGQTIGFFPQLMLTWNPEKHGDRRSTVPDLGVGIYCDYFPFILLRGGFEVKDAFPEMMTGLPEIKTVGDDPTLKADYHVVYDQAEDQVKCAIKNKLLPNDEPVFWFISWGPYFLKVKFGPFTKPQLDTRASKENDSADWRTKNDIELRTMDYTRPLYRIGTRKAANVIKQFLRDTEHFTTRVPA
ncbi:hypothetical protein EWM64_g655 [Hericium alpestre]|uniref:Uncharacterized protein n=1 Tax=Hericium alpestre TaxID=135208 RepID=A0A4Z0ACE8_9AGAM|nr:hypothetical protein EWM64_g655 [Hericium alpestre]